MVRDVIVTMAKQEYQLSQRDRACFVSLNISLSYSRSLKVIRNDTPKYGTCVLISTCVYLVPFLIYSTWSNGV